MRVTIPFERIGVNEFKVSNKVSNKVFNKVFNKVSNKMNKTQERMIAWFNAYGLTLDFLHTQVR